MNTKPKEFARADIRARMVINKAGYMFVRIEGPVKTVKGRRGMEMSRVTIADLAEWVKS